MKFFPSENETLIITPSADQAQMILWKRVKPPPNLSNTIPISDSEFLFNGVVKDGRFRISLIIKYPDNFLPLILGRIEDAPHGSLILVEYRLFFGTRLFLTFWTLITGLLGFYLVLFESLWSYGFLAWALGGLNQVITHYNFLKSVKKSSSVLHSLFH